MKQIWTAAIGMMALCSTTQADFTTIGYAGNAAQNASNRDHNFQQGDGNGAVAYSYQISKTTVTIAQLEAAGVGSGNENYWNDGTRTVGADAPAVRVSWYEAAQYCNVLTSGNANSGVYQFDDEGTLTGVMSREEMLETGNLYYALPTLDEWYKAAYFKADGSGYSLYADGTSNTATPPTAGTDGWNYGSSSPWSVGKGAEEQNGTFNMMGNVYEWTETFEESGGNTHAVRLGGRYSSSEEYLRSSNTSITYPEADTENYIGFRVVAIPEPAAASLILLFGTGFLFAKRRFS
ncbi:hypothetical protein EGM51_09365 [Verrucomicrobia bacterium S94]|nr:hypothetical protein EGM51_09365 [Verrucomicrobia bacterium S94]